MNKKVSLFLGMFAAMLVGIVVSAYAQSSTAAKLARLSEEMAEISKMDMVLLNTRAANRKSFQRMETRGRVWGGWMVDMGARGDQFSVYAEVVVEHVTSGASHALKSVCDRCLEENEKTL